MGLREELTRLWRGPFYIEVPSKPVSTGEAIFKILEIIWKIGVCALYFVAFIITLIATAEVLKNIQSALTKDSRVPQLEEEVDVTAVYLGGDCRDPLPLQIVFNNRSSRSIGFQTWRLWIRQKGRSTDLATDQTSGYSDWIINPRTSMSYCVLIPDSILQSVGAQNLEIGIRSFTVRQHY